MHQGNSPNTFGVCMFLLCAWQLPNPGVLPEQPRDRLKQKAGWVFGRDIQLLCQCPERLRFPSPTCRPERSSGDSHTSKHKETEGAEKVAAGVGCGSSSNSKQSRAWATMLPSGNELVNRSCWMCVHGGSPAAVTSITCDFIFISLEYETGQGIAEISRSSEKPTLSSCSCSLLQMLLPKLRKDRFCSHLNLQQIFQVLWEPDGSKACSSYPECSWLALSTVSRLTLLTNYSVMRQWFWVAFGATNASFFLGNWPCRFHHLSPLSVSAGVLENLSNWHSVAP